MEIILAIVAFFLLAIIGFVVYFYFFVKRKIRKFFGGDIKKEKPETENQWNSQHRQEKVFKKDEGEYVDFEEIKDKE